MSDVLNVLVADDHAPARAGVRAALETTPFVVVAEAADASSAVRLALEHRPDVCLVDVHMPGGGIAAAAKIASRLPNAAIVMLTVSRNDDDLFDALRAGAAGYLLKDIDPARLPEALRGVVAGEAAVPRSLVARLIDQFRGQERHRVPIGASRGVTLTSREWQIFELLREGLTTKQIAERLYVAQPTVRSHVAAILHKLEVPDRASAVRLLQGIGDRR